MCHKLFTSLLTLEQNSLTTYVLKFFNAETVLGSKFKFSDVLKENETISYQSRFRRKLKAVSSNYWFVKLFC